MDAHLTLYHIRTRPRNLIPSPHRPWQPLFITNTIQTYNKFVARWYTGEESLIYLEHHYCDCGHCKHLTDVDQGSDDSDHLNLWIRVNSLLTVPFSTTKASQYGFWREAYSRGENHIHYWKHLFTAGSPFASLQWWYSPPSPRFGPDDSWNLANWVVYHIDASSAEPVGGIARFKTVCNEYRDDARFQGQPELLTFFSGDAFNPSLESSVTKGMTIILKYQYSDGFINYHACRKSYGSSFEHNWDGCGLRWSTLLHWMWMWGLADIVGCRIMTWTLEFDNSDISRVNARFHGSSQTS